MCGTSDDLENTRKMNLKSIKDQNISFKITFEKRGELKEYQM